VMNARHLILSASFSIASALISPAGSCKYIHYHRLLTSTLCGIWLYPTEE
jgi:hypothetical protein